MRAVRMKPRHVVAFLLALLLGMLLAPFLHAQPVGEARFVAGVVGPARVTLDAQWDDWTVDQVERAYCVKTWEMQAGLLNGSPAVGLAVVQLERPKWVGKATSNSITFACAPNQPTVHTHPPTTCAPDGTRCYLDRFRQTPATCRPSPQDRRYANAVHAPFHVVMCGPGIFSFYFPAPEAAPPDSAAGTASRVALPQATTGWDDVQATHDLISGGALILTAIFLVSVVNNKQLGEIHHAYYGLAMIAWPHAPLWVRGLGFLILADDAYQHSAQIWNRDYRSPLHRAYGWVLGRVR